MAEWTVCVADLGASEVELTGAEPGRIEWVLNQAGSFSFTMDQFDPQAALCLPLAREAHVKRDGTLVWAGPIIGRNVDPQAGTVTFDCEGLLSYFGQRNIDSGADRTNLLANPEFEDDLTSWTAVNTTATAETSQRILGAKSAQLVQADAREDAYLKQTLDDYGATGVGSLLTAVAWFRIDPAAWIGEALGDLGLVVSRLDGTGNIITSGFFPIDGDTPRGSWQRAEAAVWMPPNAVEDIQVRLYSPGGTIWWDAASLTLMESLSSVEDVDDFLMDQATIVENIVLFLQDPAHGKDDLAITTDCPTSGVERERHHQFAEHTPGLAAILEFTEMRDGGDVSVSPDRVFHFHYRRKGTDRTATVTLSTTNCELQGERFDGRAAASGVVVLGDGDGPDREEGGAVDTSLFDGRTIEVVVSPRATTAIDTLDEMADEELDRRSDPRVLDVLVTDSALAALLEEGDIVDVDFDLGVVQASGDWRIVARAADPAIDDTDAERLYVTLNPWVGP